MARYFCVGKQVFRTIEMKALVLENSVEVEIHNTIQMVKHSCGEPIKVQYWSGTNGRVFERHFKHDQHFLKVETMAMSCPKCSLLLPLYMTNVNQNE